MGLGRTVRSSRRRPLNHSHKSDESLSSEASEYEEHHSIPLPLSAASLPSSDAVHPDDQDYESSSKTKRTMTLKTF